ncbi:MAG: GntR family transcriptional regulator [Silicimonas sp.]|nr:GntR family transcriptional regulator [Silicimonas sp.]
MTSAGRQSWRDLRDHIRGRILDQTFRPGDKLPRDEDLAQEFQCARTTVQRAMQALVDDGLVERKRKGGTTVRPDPVTRTTLDIPITRAEIEARGHGYRHHLIDRSTPEAPATIAARFGTPDPGKLLRLRALHLADGQPYVFEDRWVSFDTVPEIAAVDFSQVSSNEWLVRNRPYSRCEVQIYASPCTADEAAIMEVEPGTAMLVLERTTWLDEAPITHVRALHAPGYRLITGEARPGKLAR